jgi:hypothetical protein
LFAITGSKEYETDNAGIATDDRVSLYSQIKTL